MTLAGDSSRVLVQAGLLPELERYVPVQSVSFLVTDRNVEPLVPAAFAQLPRHVLTPGETSKTWDELGRLLAALDQAGVDRDGQLLAVGGGVVTDIAGMAASLHRRGIRWSAVPTSLVGQVDAAYGGKTAVNLGGGKNTVGTFHEPQAVLVDPTALATLPERHLRAGMAEVLKTALIAGPPLSDQVVALELLDLTRSSASAREALAGCVATKRALVAEDLHDTGRRRLLNLGHTFGHAFEALTLPELLHGEAVGLGLICAARLAEAAVTPPPGPLEQLVVECLARWGLPRRVDLDRDAVLAEMGRDKKRQGGALTLIVPRAPGQVEIVSAVPAAQVGLACEAVLGP